MTGPRISRRLNGIDSREEALPPNHKGPHGAPGGRRKIGRDRGRIAHKRVGGGRSLLPDMLLVGSRSWAGDDGRVMSRSHRRWSIVTRRVCDGIIQNETGATCVRHRRFRVDRRTCEYISRPPSPPSPSTSPQFSSLYSRHVVPGQGDHHEALRWPEARHFRSPQEVSSVVSAYQA